MESVTLGPSAIRGPPELSIPELRLSRGRLCLVLGSNGSGKTTLVNGIAKDAGGDVRIRPVRTPDARAGRPTIARTWQHARLVPGLSLARHAAVADAASTGRSTPLRASHPPEGSLDRYQHEPLVAELGLAGRLYRPAAQLALSEQKRGALYLALRSAADLVLLDEPLAGLDAENQRRVRDVIAKAALCRPLMVTEQVSNLRLLRSIPLDLFLMQDGQLTPADLDAVPVLDQEVWEGHVAPNGERRHLEWGAASLMVMSSKPASGTGRRLDIGRCWRLRLHHDDMPQAGALDIPFDGPTLVVLRAPNGWGKTSLLASIANGHRVGDLSAALVPPGGDQPVRPQNLFRLGARFNLAGAVPFPSLSVEAHLALAGASGEAAEIGLPGGRRTQLLSGGERATLLGAAALMSRGARFVFLDEPLLGVDPERSAQILGMCRQFLEGADGPALCFVTSPAAA